MLHLKQYQQPASFIGFMASAITLIASTTFINNAKVASVATLAGTVSLYGYVKTEQENNQARLKDDLDTAQRTLSQLETALNECKASENNLLSKIKPYILPDGTMFNVSSQSELIASMRDNIDRLGERLQTSETSLLGVKGERESLKLDLDRLNGQIASLESSKAHWSKEFDKMISENERLEKENNKFQAQFSSIEEVAKLRANAESRALEDKLKELNQEYTKVATLYNSAVTDLKKLNAEYVSEFSELNEAVNKGLPEAFDAVLNARDKELLRVSGIANQSMNPQFFDSIGEFDRANRLIKALYDGELGITLDRCQIVPYDDKTGFDVSLSMRDSKARGQAFIDVLNDQGNQLSVICGCIKDLKFEYDRVNPHLIKTAMVFRKASKSVSKTDLSGLWIPSDRFDRVIGLLKKPITKVMGASMEGKGIFVNSALAIEANKPVPKVVKLHDPEDGSEGDHWQISKVSKNLAETSRAILQFESELHRRNEEKVSKPEIIEIFDEVDKVKIEERSSKKIFVDCAKNARHWGLNAFVVGQSPSARDVEWADFDNFNCVYFGAAIQTAIDKTPCLQSSESELNKRYKKLKDFCDSESEKYGLEDGDKRRVGLLVTGGKGQFFELPQADSIVCDWSKLTSIFENFDAKAALACPECQSQNVGRKPRSANKKLASGLIRKYHVCSDCNHDFTTDS